MGASDRFSKTIPKAKVDGVAPWELRPLDARHRMPGPATLSARAGDARHDPHDNPHSYESGHAQGRAEGHAEGHAEALRQATQARAADVQRLESLIVQLRSGFDELSGRTADVLLDLALDIAAQVVRREVGVHRDVVLPVVREALGMVIDSHAHPTLRLAPVDFALVREALQDDGRFQGCRCVEDPAIAPGGCRVETAHGQIDASLATRWQRVVQSLGHDMPAPEPARPEPPVVAAQDMEPPGVAPAPEALP